MGMFDALRKTLNKFAKSAEETAKDAPAPPSPPARVGQHDPKSKAEAAREFDREMFEVVAPKGAPPNHAIQGAEFEEGDRARVPAPKPELSPPRMPGGVETEVAKPSSPPSSSAPPRSEPPAPAKAPTAAPPRPPHPPSKAPAAAPPKPAPAPKGGKAIDPAKVQDLLWDLELALLESDVALEVVEEIKERLEKQLPEIRVPGSDEIPAAVEDALREALRGVLSRKIDWDEWLLDRMAQRKPVVIMFVGVNGTGKTTAIGRLAHRLREDGFSTIMAAGDTFRAGAIEQLSLHGERLGVPVVKTQPGGDPAAVAYDAIEAAKARKKDVVLLDTAGRMQTNTNLMDEMKKIKRVAEPDMIVFVGDSLAGNDAVEQARKFDAAVGIDAAILTKVDTDAKGGAALSIAHAVGKPLLFLGVGQEYGDLIPYDPDWMVARIFES